MPLHPSIGLGTSRRAVLLCCVLMGVSASCSPSAEEPQPAVPAPEVEVDDTFDPPPNVLLLVMDTVRADRCAILGYERPTTPHLEQLAANSVTFTNAWSPSRWTIPSHASLFTGLLPGTHGCRPSLGTTLREDVPTIAEMLQGAGYSTAAFVSNPAFEMEPGLLRGFDVVRRHYGMERPRGVSGPLCDELHGLARGWVHGARRHARPYFLFVNDVDPHSPYQPHPDPQRRLVREDASDAEITAGRRFDAAAAIAHNFGRERIGGRALAIISDLYDAEVATIDMYVGKLLAELERDGALENTLVIITSDHGEYLGAHGLLDHMHGVHQDVLRVPLLIRHPDRAEAGSRVDDVVRLEDVVPTILEACRITPPALLDGGSLLASVPGRVALGESPVNPFVAPEGAASPVSAEATARIRPCRSVTQGRWHLIAYDDGESELYDRSVDPGEASDIAAAHPETVAQLRTLLD